MPYSTDFFYARRVRIVVGVVQKERRDAFCLIANDRRDARRIQLCQLVARRRCEDDFIIVEELRRMREIAGHTAAMTKALFSGKKCRLGAEVPFADHVGGAALLLELLGDLNLIRMQIEEPVGRSVRVDSHKEPVTLRISPRQERRP